MLFHAASSCPPGGQSLTTKPTCYPFKLPIIHPPFSLFDFFTFHVSSSSLTHPVLLIMPKKCCGAVSGHSTVSSALLSSLRMHLSVVTHCFIPFLSFSFIRPFLAVTPTSTIYLSLSPHSLLSGPLYISSGSSALPADDLRFDEAWL